jgi:hypothetical protein
MWRGDHECGQRVVNRFSVFPRADDSWSSTALRHWSVDQPYPR